MNCTGTFDAPNTCSVIDASMLIFGNGGDKRYDEMLSPVVNEMLRKGRLNNVHPAIVTTAVPESTTSSSSIWSDKRLYPVWIAIAGVVAGFALLVVAVVIIRKLVKSRRMVDVSDRASEEPKLGIDKGFPSDPPPKERPISTVYTSGPFTYQMEV